VPIIRHALGFVVDAMRLVQNLPCFADASRELGIAHRKYFRRAGLDDGGKIAGC
jgi:hypothetical protein